MLHSVELDQDIVAPPLTEDDAFNSHPMLGNIAYRLPSMDVLMNMPMNFMDKFQTMKFTLSLIVMDPDMGPLTVACRYESKCSVTYVKEFTPVLYYVSPSVVYFQSYTELWFDPKNTQKHIWGLESDEMKFINARIGGSLLDFEF